MPKFAEKPVEAAGNSNVEFPSFDATRANDQFRAFAEKGVEQSKEAYAKMRAGAEETQKALEATFETVKTTGSDLSLKTIAALRSSTEAGFNHLERLVAVKSLSELLELQTAFVRNRFETGMEQARDFQAAASKAAEQIAKPMKDVVERAVAELKVA